MLDGAEVRCFEGVLSNLLTLLGCLTAVSDLGVQKIFGLDRRWRQRAKLGRREVLSNMGTLSFCFSSCCSHELVDVQELIKPTFADNDSSIPVEQRLL